MYNYSLLLGKMRAENKTQEDVGKAIGKNKATVNQKLRNKALFTQREIDSICELLGIVPDDIGKYFFAH